MNTLEPFLLLAKQATGRAAADLVMQALAADGVYTFAELLDMRNIDALRQGEWAPTHRLLQIFSYGALSDLQQEGLPPLGEKERNKLRQLSLVSLVLRESSVSYAALLPALDLHSARELEALVISAVYAELLDAKLDARNERVEVRGVRSGRDLAPGEGEQVRCTLTAWRDTCDTMVDELQRQVVRLRDRGKEEREQEREFRRQVEQMTAQVAAKEAADKPKQRQMTTATMSPAADDEPACFDGPWNGLTRKRKTTSKGY